MARSIDRVEFLDWMKTFMQEHEVKLIQALRPDMVVFVTHKDDFNKAEQDQIWLDDQNRSDVRYDVNCTTCGGIVAMSNWAYPQYLAMIKKPKIVCNRCAPALLEAAAAQNIEVDHVVREPEKE